ncbi:MAG: valine--tRNA ligase [Candidatus Paceibacterota bacterium]|jgi:valyl-tRNA synthetase
MDEKLLKPYNPQETEPRIYKKWEESGFFNPDNMEKAGLIKKDAKTFTIILPPPNVTGILHMGHALMATLQDIMIRFHRMRGDKTLWLPGTDHAAIATQSRVEKDIKKSEDKSRYDLGRDELLKRVEAFAKNSHDTIIKQIKTLGASCDWSREAFTLDEKRSLAVRTVFKKMYDEGLIYRGDRIVNWDPRGATTISDDEIVYVEEKTKFYYFKYGPFVIGTSRPETKFGDKYVVMHPDDTRYKKYKNGDKIDLEWINGPITATIIKDSSIDMTFGTGVMTITPWHSVADFEIAERHGLDKEQIIDNRGKLLAIAGEFSGMKITDARSKIIEKLKAKGLLEKEEDYTHNIATAERTGGIIEPQIMKQWFVAVNKKITLPYSEINGIPSGSETTLKEIMKKAVAGGQIKIIPDYFDKTYFHWIENLRDWCISRQIWYGHRIPVWYRENNEIHCGIDAPKGDGWEQDSDTLDTWFSSALWTFSTLGWPFDCDTQGKPKKNSDLEIFHPTDVLETGYEILFFWVARMILMTGYVLGTIPFKTVYLHGTVRDAKGRKMSKSLNNGIDPMDIAQKFGTDAGRMALIVGTAPGTDSKVSEEKIRGYKNFANKLWNITRFVLSNTDGVIYDQKQKPKLSPTDEKIISDFDLFIKEITEEMLDHKYYISSEKIYHYVWHNIADKIIEDSKSRLTSTNSAEDRSSAQYMLLYLLTRSLIILHPFVPFVTEELWSLIPIKDKRLLMVEHWPML